jgi:hypothetical protein
MWWHTITMLLYAPFFFVGFSISLMSMVGNLYGLDSTTKTLILALVGATLATAFLLHHRRVRRDVIALERTARGRCLSCGHELATVESPSSHRRRCSECGHLWVWPLPPVPPVRA